MNSNGLSDLTRELFESDAVDYYTASESLVILISKEDVDDLDVEAYEILGRHGWARDTEHPEDGEFDPYEYSTLFVFRPWNPAVANFLADDEDDTASGFRREAQLRHVRGGDPLDVLRESGGWNGVKDVESRDSTVGRSLFEFYRTNLVNGRAPFTDPRNVPEDESEPDRAADGGDPHDDPTLVTDGGRDVVADPNLSNPRHRTTDVHCLVCEQCGHEFLGAVVVDTWSGEAMVECPMCGRQQEPRPAD